MGKTNNTIEINGQRYDVQSGAVVEAKPSTKPTKRSIDGFTTSKVSPIVPVPKASAKRAPLKPTTSLGPKKMVDGIVRRKASSLQPHTPQSGATLMRHAVKKPSKSFKRATKVLTPQMPIAVPTKSITSKSGVHSVDHKRLQRAKQTPTSQKVRRFQPTPHSNSANSGHLVRDTMTPAAVIPLAPPIHAVSVEHSQATMFQRAIDQATGHLEPNVRTAKEVRRAKLTKRLLLVGGGTLAVIAIVGLSIVQSWSAISVHLASSRSGVAASLPSYEPSGYHVGTIESVTGTVAMHYSSNTGDNRAYTVSEKTSTWDSQTLRDSDVQTASNGQFQAVETGGQTLYLYGNRTVTWVSGGIWYTITSNGSLSDSQLENIARSL